MTCIYSNERTLMFIYQIQKFMYFSTVSIPYKSIIHATQKTVYYLNWMKFPGVCPNLFTEKRNFHVADVLRKDVSSKRKVKETVVLVTVVDASDKILGLKSKEESEKLARKLNLSLVQVTDRKYGTKYPAYKLTPSSEILKGLETKATSKSLKKLALNSRISEHDLEIKLATIKKWIAKNCQINVAISGGSSSESTRINLYEMLKGKLGNDVRILDVRNKQDDLKFTIIPAKKISKQVALSEENASEEKTNQ